MKKRKIFRMIKKAILGTVMMIDFVAFGFSLIALDSPSLIPKILCVITFGILVLFAYANGAVRGFEKLCSQMTQ